MITLLICVSLLISLLTSLRLTRTSRMVRVLAFGKEGTGREALFRAHQQSTHCTARNTHQNCTRFNHGLTTDVNNVAKQDIEC